MNTLNTLLTGQAEAFATNAHRSINQKRRYTGEDYIVHPEEVVRILKVFVADITTEQIEAAWLHDVVEDTPWTLKEIRSSFGINVAVLVENLTDISKPEDGNRAVRKRIDRIHTSQASPKAKTIKLADLISNLHSIVEHDPKFAKVYLAETEELLLVLTEGNERLWNLLTQLVKEAKEELGLWI